MHPTAPWNRFRNRVVGGVLYLLSAALFGLFWFLFLLASRATPGPPGSLVRFSLSVHLEPDEPWMYFLFTALPLILGFLATYLLWHRHSAFSLGSGFWVPAIMATVGAAIAMWPAAITTAAATYLAYRSDAAETQ